MKPNRFRLWLGALLTAIIVYVFGVFLINASLTPQADGLEPALLPGLPDAVPATITLTSWNLGYAGLGADSNFIADGGSALFPPSPATVERNLSGILASLGAIDADVMLFQEVSNKSPLNFWAAVRDRLDAAMAGRQIFYRPDAATRFIPFPLALDHGTLSTARFNPARVEIVPLPSEPGAMLGFLKRRYALHVMRFPIEARSGELVIANLHLSAFDDNGDTRREQIGAVMAFAEAEYRAGNHVILGGDWNMVLADPAIPHTTDEKYLFWIHPFPTDSLPPDWTIATDSRTPSVRTLHKPYVAGENFVTSIDGFIVSPNISLDSVSTLDQGFRYSDHHPVRARFSLK